MSEAKMGCCFLAILLACCTVVPFGCNAMLGIGGLGPTRTHDVTVERLYVDAKGDSGSSYMVGTDQGVFEVDNGFILGVWNSDELYSRLQQGKRYRITTEGRRIVNWMFQEYPYITRIEDVK